MKPFKLNVADQNTQTLELQHWPEQNIVALQAKQGNITSKIFQIELGTLTIFDHELITKIVLKDGTVLYEK